MGDNRSGSILAVDFGTSNSAAGIFVDGHPQVIELEPGNATLPTSVFFDFSNNEILIGTPANQALIQGREGRFMRSLKSVLGTSLMREKRWIMGQELTFIDIISLFLNRVKTKAEAATARSFDRALSGRPVHFHSSQAGKDAQALIDLTECYHCAGFDSVQFMLEPEAAALASGDLGGDGPLGLIVDIGGGTSDFTVFRQISGGETQILASHGVRIGGTDFDKSLSVDHVMPLFGKGSQIGREMGAGSFTAPNAIFNELATWQKIQFQYSAKARHEVAQLQKLAVRPALFGRLANVLESELGHDVAFAVERGKISANVAGGSITAIDLGVVEPSLKAQITRDDLNNALAEHIEKIRTCAVEVLTMAECPAERISKVIFVGGSSLMTAVETSMAGLFPDAVLEYSDAFTAIVDGLAIASGGSATD